MDCDFCSKKATVFLTQLVEGQMKKVCLCEDCAKAQGVTDPTGFSLADMLLGSVAGLNPEGGAAASAPASRGRACPSCGFTMEDLRRVRRFGCSDCYRTFAEEVQTMLRGMHAGTIHQGKVPKGHLEQRQRRQRLDDLRTRLDQAVAAENYEEAASLRDEIRKMELPSGAARE